MKLFQGPSKLSLDLDIALRSLLTLLRRSNQWWSGLRPHVAIDISYRDKIWARMQKFGLLSCKLGKILIIQNLVKRDFAACCCKKIAITGSILKLQDSSFTCKPDHPLKLKLKSAQAGTSRTKLDQTQPHGAKRDNTGQPESNGAKWVKRVQMGLIFACRNIFMRWKYHV